MVKRFVFRVGTGRIGFARGQFGEDSIFGRTYENLVREGGPEKTIEEVIGVITNKRPENLTEEDYGKAAGFLEITAEIQKGEVSRRERQEFEVAEPNGNRNRFIRVENLEASKWIEAKLHEFAQLFSLSSETAKAIAIETVCNVDIPSCSVAAQKNEPSLSLLNADELSNLDND